MGNLKICDFSDGLVHKWNGYVLSSSEATFYHQIAWKNIVEKIFKHKPYYLYYEADDHIKGILPLFWVKSYFLKISALISLPGANYSNICADSKVIKNSLIDGAIKLAWKLNVQYLEIRGFQPLESFLTTTNNVVFIIPLSSDINNVWEKLGKNVQGKIKKAEESGLSFDFGHRYLLDFYRVYLNTMHRLGTPPYSLEFFKSILDEFGSKSTIFVTKYKDRVIASDLFVFFKQTMTSLYSGAYQQFFPLAPNNFICWEEIKYGCNNGFEYYDFGRSQLNTGTFEFKKYWGGKITPLYYCFCLNKNKMAKLPDKNPNSPKYKLLRFLWRFIPLSLTKVIGNNIVKFFH